MLNIEVTCVILIVFCLEGSCHRYVVPVAFYTSILYIRKGKDAGTVLENDFVRCDNNNVKRKNGLKVALPFFHESWRRPEVPNLSPAPSIRL
jgi:hypothetical protein